MNKENKAASHTPLIDHHYKTYHHRQSKTGLHHLAFCCPIDRSLSLETLIHFLLLEVLLAATCSTSIFQSGKQQTKNITHTKNITAELVTKNITHLFVGSKIFLVQRMLVSLLLEHFYLERWKEG
ncbi:hypothetical protein ACJX0J_034859 [Zea mays]